MTLKKTLEAGALENTWGENVTSASLGVSVFPSFIRSFPFQTDRKPSDLGGGNNNRTIGK